MKTNDFGVKIPSPAGGTGKGEGLVWARAFRL